MIITASEVRELAFSPSEDITHQAIRDAKIAVAAEKYIRPRFGDELFERFNEGEYAPFVAEYIKPALAHYVRYSIVDELSIQMSDNGAVTFDARESESNLTREQLQSAQAQVDAERDETAKTQSQAESTKTTEATADKTASKDVETTLDKSELQADKISSTVNVTATKDFSDFTRNVTEEVEKRSHNATDNTTIRYDKVRDYQFNEGPVSVGVSTVGYSMDYNDETNKLVKNGTDNNNRDIEVSGNHDGGSNESAETKETANNSKNTTTEQTDNQTVTESAEQSSTETVTAENNDTRNRELHSTRTQSETREGKLTDDNRRSSQTRNRRAATDFQRRIIKSRAFADANILLTRAIRYVERNAELFPEYEPQSRAARGIVL